MASAKRGSKTSAKKAPAKKAAAKNPMAKKSATKRKAAAKRPVRTFSQRKRDAAIVAAVALVGAGATLAVRTARRRMASATAATAAARDACTIVNRGDVSQIVITYIRGLGFPKAAEGSNFTTGVPTTASARRVWAGDLVDIVERRGCGVSNDFGPDQCAEAKKVRDIVDSLWDAVKTANGIEES